MPPKNPNTGQLILSAAIKGSRLGKGFKKALLKTNWCV